MRQSFWLERDNFVLLRELPDWPRIVDPSYGGVLRSAKSSQLGHFAILEIESEGRHAYKLLEVGAHRIDKVLSLLNANIGRSLDEIGELAIDV